MGIQVNHENDPHAGQVFAPPLLYSDFRWPLLLPALLWLAGLLCYLWESAASVKRVHTEGEA